MAHSGALLGSSGDDQYDPDLPGDRRPHLDEGIRHLPLDHGLCPVGLELGLHRPPALRGPSGGPILQYVWKSALMEMIPWLMGSFHGFGGKVNLTL